MLGILVFGDNHFILRGPLPNELEARELAYFWSFIQVGGTPATYKGWEIRTKEFREELEWVVVVPHPLPIQPAVQELLDQLAGRGIPIRMV
jgi:hypothetical protein